MAVQGQQLAVKRERQVSAKGQVRGRSGVRRDEGGAGCRDAAPLEVGAVQSDVLTRAAEGDQ